MGPADPCNKTRTSDIGAWLPFFRGAVIMPIYGHARLGLHLLSNRAFGRPFIGLLSAQGVLGPRLHSAPLALGLPKREEIPKLTDRAPAHLARYSPPITPGAAHPVAPGSLSCTTSSPKVLESLCPT
jgi:hypothetical protein